VLLNLQSPSVNRLRIVTGEVREAFEADLKKNLGPVPSPSFLKGEGRTASEQVLMDRDLP